jgi:hypothetical protein
VKTGHRGGYGPVSLRVDSGFYTVELLEACRRQRVEFCVSVARTEAMWARDGAEHRRIRRQENVGIHGNLSSLRTHLGLAKPPVFDFACECGTLGCRERVLLTIDEYGTALEPPGRYVVLQEHTREGGALPLGETASVVRG